MPVRRDRPLAGAHPGPARGPCAGHVARAGLLASQDERQTRTHAARAPVEGPVLLVDDVATSGRHIEEASLLLRAQKPGCGVLAVAWIGGSADDR